MSVMEVLAPGPQLRARDDEPLYEVVNGQTVELPPMSFHSNKIASRLSRRIADHTDAKNLGEVVNETLFRVPIREDQHRIRRPDVAYVSYARWPREKAESVRENAWDVVPDLVIEVVSPSDSAADLMDKVAEYFEAGVGQVWVVYPQQKIIHIHDALRVVHAVGPDDVLDGGQILPGLRLSLKEVFVFNLLAEPSNGDD